MAENLYRKYRPKTFNDVVGQDHIKRYFKNAINNDKVSHAYLLSGIRGVGKTSLARIISMAINNSTEPSFDFDINDKICQAILKQQCPDVHEMDAASNTSIEDTREIRSRAHNVPIMCRKRVFIIDEVHCLNKKAVSALLKVLEEPPPHVVFIMATTEPNNVLDTILSRCQRLELKKLTNDQIYGRLEHICKNENKEFDEKALKIVAKSGQGSLRDAISNLEIAIGSSDKKITTEDVEDFIVATDREFFMKVLKSIFDKKAAKGIHFIHERIQEGKDPENIYMSLLENTNDMLITKIFQDIDLIYIEEGVKERWERALEQVDDRLIINMHNILIKNAQEIKNSPKPEYLLDQLILNMIIKS